MFRGERWYEPMKSNKSDQELDAGREQSVTHGKEL